MDLKDKGRNPPIVVLENVSGLITSNKGKDLTSLLEVFAGAGYWVGALEIDAATSCLSHVHDFLLSPSREESYCHRA